ncbi:DUF2339 domain-containing protein [Aquicella siphonis]|nr:DUF2339 domain-containing protein [Aquicella siphonis]
MDARLSELERRLARIEAHLDIKLPSSIPEHHGEPKPKPEAKPEVPTETAKSGNWLGVTAIICFILAAGFIIKLAVDSGWLTPPRQIAIAVIFGLTLIMTGLALLRTDKAYAGLLPAAGVIVLYLSVFGAYQYYHLINFPAAIASTSLVSALCIVFYLRIRHDVYAIISAIGAYIAPVLLELDAVSIFSLYYFVFCSLTFATISIWVRSRVFVILAAYLAILVNGVVGFDLGMDILIAVILLLHFLVFSFGTFLYTYYSRTPLTQNESWGFFPVLLLFYALEYYFINRVYPDAAPWISLAFTAVLLGLYLSAKKLFPGRVMNSQSMIIAFITLALFHSVYIEIIPSDLRPWLFAFIVIVFAYLPAYFLTSAKETSVFPLIALFIILGVEYDRMIYHLIADYQTSWLTVSMAAFASIWLLLLRQHEQIVKKDEFGYAILGCAHLLAVTGLYQLTTDHGSLAVSTSWLFYALLVIGIAFARKDKIMAKSALFVLGFAAAKALLYDAASAPTVVRILCLLLTGAVLYGAGFLFRHIAGWKS